MHQTGGTFYRDDEVRNIVYQIHEQNSLKIRRARFGDTNAKKARKDSILRKAAAAAGIAVMASPAAVAVSCTNDDNGANPDAAKAVKTQKGKVDPPHS